MIYAGIDVSKDTLHLAYHLGDHRDFANSPAGRECLCRELQGKGQPIRVVLEPTATYHLPITQHLAQTDGIDVMVANPRATANYAKVISQRGKTDPKDGAMLAAFGAIVGFKAWTAPSENVVRLRELMRRRQQLVVMRTQEKVRVKEMKHVGADPFLLDDLKASIAFLTERIGGIEKVALLLVRSDDELDRWRRMLSSMPGIGDVLAMVITGELIHLPEDISGRQMTAYAGLDPKVHQSGKQDGRRTISRRGNKRLRTALYLAALTAASNNPHVKAYKAKHLARGKAPKLVNIAIARRYLHVIEHLRQCGGQWDGERFHALQEGS